MTIFPVWLCSKKKFDRRGSHCDDRNASTEWLVPTTLPAPEPESAPAPTTVKSRVVVLTRGSDE